MKKLLLITLLSSSIASAATQYGLSSTLYHSSNPDELVENKGVGENVLLFDNNLTAKKKLKGPLKSSVISKTTLDLKLADMGDAYSDVDLVNEDDVNTTLRRVSLNQDFNFIKKVSKNTILSLGLDVEISQGYSVEQEFPTTDPPIIYHIIEDEYVKGGIDLGSAFRLSKKNTLKLKYKFTEYDHQNKYTFDKVQGTNDRRIHTLAVQDQHKFSKSTSGTVVIQVDNITYRDRLALDNVGFFRSTGEVEASEIQDQSLELGLSLFKSALQIKAKKENRIDLIDNGDGFGSSDLSLEAKKSIGRIKLELLLSYGETLYTSQLDSDTQDEKRKDINTTNMLSVITKLGGFMANSTVTIFVEQRRIDSNNRFGDYDINRAGLALKTKF